MPRKFPRIILYTIDMLAGHWSEDGVIVESTGLHAPNVMDYHYAGLIPNISSCINTGIWTKRPMNWGKCFTPFGIRYLAAGRYDTEHVDWVRDICTPYPDGEYKTIIEAIEKHYPELKIATFGSGLWVEPGFYYTTQHCMHLPPYYPDEKEMNEYVYPYIKENPDWDVMVIYLPEHDLTAAYEGTPVFIPDPKTPISDKHHSIVDHVDRLLGDLIKLLKTTGAWDDTIMFITSDHAYHHGCDTAINMANKANIDDVSRTKELCFDHIPSWDCRPWDYEKNQRLKKWSDCCRRVVQIATGGAIPKELQGTVRETGDICDTASTIAMLLGIPYESTGQTIFKL